MCALVAGARQHRLRQSRRSLPALVRFANALFARALAPGFTLGEDDLEPLRPAGAPGPRAELLHVEAAGKDAPEAEANAVARPAYTRSWMNALA